MPTGYFYLDSGDLNSSFQVCVSSVLTTGHLGDTQELVLLRCA